ncbi:MAG TPA: COX15/CtaA family protein [Gemmatimonadales bacterium]|nr:COX15/CtaA family protein [Gemmatimonadales bacterium]
MTRRFTPLAWTAVTFTYLLIVLGAIVRITGSGLGCGEHWPLCNGRLLPPLDVPTLIEYAHRLVAAAVSGLVLALAVYAGRLRGRHRRASVGANASRDPAAPGLPSALPYAALGLLVVLVLLGAVTVRLRLPPWTVVLHFATAMLLLATLLVVARERSEGWLRDPGPTGLVALVLGFATVLAGALTANTGAASACLGFPLCNGQLVPSGNALQHIHWTHRVLAYALFAFVIWWAVRAKRRAVWGVVGLVGAQVTLAAAMVLLQLPRPLAAAHVALGAAVWGGLVVAAL